MFYYGIKKESECIKSNSAYKILQYALDKWILKRLVDK